MDVYNFISKLHLLTVMKPESRCPTVQDRKTKIFFIKQSEISPDRPLKICRGIFAAGTGIRSRAPVLRVNFLMGIHLSDISFLIIEGKIFLPLYKTLRKRAYYHHGRGYIAENAQNRKDIINMKYLVLFTVIVLFLCTVGGVMPALADFAIYENTVRLHVLAASDDAHDQEVKLLVRDAVLREMEMILADAKTYDDANAILCENLDRIRLVCNATLVSLGEDARVTVLFSKENYPTRHYESMSLPAGVYQSLQIRIGEGKGQNFWCVLYPALCEGPAKTEAILQKTGFTPDQIDILTDGESPKYKIKFKILEFFGENFPSNTR